MNFDTMLDKCWKKVKQLDPDAVLYECVSPQNETFVQTIFGGSQFETISLYCTCEGNLTKPFTNFGNKWQGDEIVNPVAMSKLNAENLLLQAGNSADWDLVTLRVMNIRNETQNPSYFFEWFSGYTVSVNTVTHQVAVINK